MSRVGRAIAAALIAASCSSSGSGSGDDGTGETCSASADTCADETICVDQACEAAFPRVYAITDITLMVPTTDPSGSDWDAGGGAPDLYVVISVNGSDVAMTDVVNDEFSASYPGPYQVSLIAGSSLDLHAYDQDVLVDDPALDCQANPLTAAQLRGRLLSCSAAGETMMFTIDPQ